MKAVKLIIVCVLTIFAGYSIGAACDENTSVVTSGQSFINAFKTNGNDSVNYGISAEGGGDFFAQGKKSVSGFAETDASGYGYANDDGNKKSAGASVVLETNERATTDQGKAKVSYYINAHQGTFVEFDGQHAYYWAGNETGAWSSDLFESQRGTVAVGGKVVANGQSGGEFIENENTRLVRSFTTGFSAAENFRKVDPGVYGHGGYGGFVEFSKGTLYGNAGYNGEMSYNGTNNGSIKGFLDGSGEASVTIINGPDKFRVDSVAGSSSKASVTPGSFR